MKIFIFGGTAEGRMLSQALAQHNQGVQVVLSVATDYGKDMITPEKNIIILSKPLTEDEMTRYIQQQHFDYVVDATHPYAHVATHNIQSACIKAGVPYLRLIRQGISQTDAVISVPTAEAAAEFLTNTKGNILLTTGSKELQAFTKIENYAERIFIRMLPMAESLQKAKELGFQNSHLICMQGPFCEALNKEMLLWANAGYLVTKDSGDAGGYREKLSAALSLGLKVIVIRRPTEETGLSYRALLDHFGIHKKKVLFPFFFDLTNKSILIVGGGTVAQRRIEILLRFGAKITLISETITSGLQQLVQQKALDFINRAYHPLDLERKAFFLVMAATNHRSVNESIMIDAKHLHIPHIIADCKEECDTYFPAIAENDFFITGVIAKDGNHTAVKELAENIRRMLHDR